MNLPTLILSEHATLACGIDSQEDEEQDGESPKRRTTVAEEGQRNANNGCETDDHSDVDEHVEQQDAHDAVAIDAPISVVLEFGKVDEP